jgi:hypothetical protein
MGGASAVIGNLATTAVSAMTGSGQQQQPAGGDEPQQRRGAASGDMNPGDFDKMSQVPTNPDGTPMTVDQINQIKAGQQAGNANDMSGPSPTAANPANAGKTGADFAGTRDANGTAPYATGSKDWANDRAAGNIPGQQDQGKDDYSWVNDNGSKDAPSAANNFGKNEPANAGNIPSDEPAKIVPRLPPGAKLSDFSNTSGGTIGQAFDAGNAPIGANGQPMQQVPMDTAQAPIGQNFDAGIAPIGPNGQPMQQVPMDTAQAPPGSAMDPNYLKQVISGEHPRPMISAEKAQAALDWQAQNGGQVQPPKGTWSDGGRNNYPGGLAQWYKDHPGIRENAINKQATLNEWFKKEQQGIALNTVQLNPLVVEGIFDFFKGGKKDASSASGTSADDLNKAWKAAGSPTDSEEVAKILQGAGIPADAVNKIFTDLKLPAPGATPAATPATPSSTTAGDPATPGAAPAGKVNKNVDTAYSQANKLISSLTRKQQQQVMKYLQKQLGQA